ncbi:extracellular solute-binding protein [Paenibacillus sp. J5C_2022]|uniref:extracellular solute-binding protein n=1 Tax=Paenibacillus sp. J5C2022 TaxID=2977129 RepID=UPI0021CDF34A|nr:extracellular solute-binding protein [Paenibacillus sp. J5C2022]MCU6709682.1 extracellular solute-binding protein [Paenibacillus sp. J5C2022]
MKSLQRPLSGLLSALLLGGLVMAGCSNSEKPSAEGVENGNDTTEQTITIKMFNQASFNPTSPIPPKQDDPIRQLIEKKMNINLEMTVAPDQPLQKLNTMIASGDVPDLIFFSDRKDMIKYYQDGLLADLDAYLDKAPDLMNRFPQTSWDQMKYGGKTVGIPGYDLISGPNGIWIQDNWLKKLQLDVPTTPEQLMDVMKAFTFRDPDGNGKDDTYGFIGGVTKDGMLNDFGLDTLLWMFGVTPHGFDVVDNKVVYYNTDPRMKEGIAYLNQMVSEKVIDPDWKTVTENKLLKDKMNRTKEGIVVYNWRAMDNPTNAMADENGVIPDWIIIPPMKGPHGDQILTYRAFQGNSWAISKKSADDPEKAQRIVNLLQYLFTDEEDYKTFAYGIQDINWRIVDGKAEKVRLDPDTAKKYSFLDHYKFPRRGDDAVYFSYKNPKTAEYLELNNKYLKDNNVTPYLVPDPGDTLYADRIKYVNEMLLKFITGKEPLDKWDDYVKTLETKFNLKGYLDIVTEQLKEQGVIG